MARSHIIQLADAFWNIRGSFKVGYFIDVGTHASLVRKRDGRYLLLDAYTLEPEVKAQVDRLTRDGSELEAIVNLHPFHTVHVEAMHRQYPQARLYGTARHHRLFPDLPWEEERSEDAALHERYADDLEFSVPQGVDFISDNENVHFSSVLAYHRASTTIHADDTFMVLKPPQLVNWLGLLPDYLGLHPTLPFALEKRAGAVADFRVWLTELAGAWSDARNLCAAHSGVLEGRHNRGASLDLRMLKALERVGRILSAHERKYG